MSLTEGKNVPETGKMSKTEAENVQELTEEELALPLEPIEPKSAKEKSQRRRQAIVGLISDNPSVSLEEMSEKLDVNIKTIWRDITTLKLYGIIERIGGDFGGKWKILKKKKFMIKNSCVFQRKEILQPVFITGYSLLYAFCNFFCL